jgi:rare lipoprotein A
MTWRILIHGLLNGAIRSGRGFYNRKRPLNIHSLGQGTRRIHYGKRADRSPGEFKRALESSLGPQLRSPLLKGGRGSSPLQGKDRWIVYTIKPGDTLWELAVRRFHVNVEDLIRDNGIEDPRKLQPGQKILVRRPRYGGVKEVVASWYGRRYHGRPMANGEPFNMYAPTIAHRTLPLGTKVELENPETGVKVVATVADRGPFIKGRDVDLSYGLAVRLSMVEKGVGKLRMRVLG